MIISSELASIPLGCHEKILKDNTDTDKMSDEEFLIDAKNFINLYELVENDRNLENYNTYMKKLKWYAYINKRRHEDKLLNELDNIYGKNATYIMGDWSNKGKLKYISTRTSRSDVRLH